MSGEAKICAEVWELLQRYHSHDWRKLPEEIRTGLEEKRDPAHALPTTPQGAPDAERIDPDAAKLYALLELDYLMDREERRALVHKSRMERREGGESGDTPAHRLVGELVLQAKAEGRRHWGDTYYTALCKLPDGELRREAFRLLAEETPGMVYWDADRKDEEDRLHYLGIGFCGPVSCRPGAEPVCCLPVRYHCTDGVGDVLQQMGTSAECCHQISGFDGHYEQTLEYPLRDEVFAVFRLDVSYRIDGQWQKDWALLGVDLRAARLEGVLDGLDLWTLDWAAERCPEQQLTAALKLAGTKVDYLSVWWDDRKREGSGLPRLCFYRPEEEPPPALTWAMRHTLQPVLVLTRTTPDGTRQRYRLPLPPQAAEGTAVVRGSWQDGLTMELYMDCDEDRTGGSVPTNQLV